MNNSLYPREHHKVKIRPVVVAVAIFICTMLVQTSSNNIGTMLAFGALVSIVCLAVYDNNFTINITGMYLLFIILIVIILINTLMKVGYISSSFYRLVAQIIACCMLFGVKKVNTREEKFLTNVFLYTVAICGLFILRESLSGSSGYREIILWGTSFDPNFIGIPIVATSTISLYQLLNLTNLWKKKLLLALIYIECSIIIMFTASRSNLLALIITSLLIFSVFFCNKKWLSVKSIVICGIVILGLYVLIVELQESFAQQWERMMTLGQEGSDNGRFELWKQAIYFWSSNPIIGCGFYSCYLISGMATHNTYLQILCESGIVGFSIYVGFFFRYIKIRYINNRMYFIILIGVFTQIMFLDAWDNRVVWAIFFWFTLLPSKVNNTQII